MSGSQNFSLAFFQEITGLFVNALGICSAASTAGDLACQQSAFDSSLSLSERPSGELLEEQPPTAPEEAEWAGLMLRGSGTEDIGPASPFEIEHSDASCRDSGLPQTR